MPIWKDASYFKDTSLKSVADAQIQDQDVTHDDCSFQDDGFDEYQVNTASPQVNTGSGEISTATSEVNTATSEGLMGPIPTTKDTQEEDQGKTHQDLHICLFACFLSQEEPKRVSKALSDPAWVEAMQEELLQFKLKNKQERLRGIVIRNKARLVAQGHTQEEGIDYDEVFVPVARIEAIRIFLAYASYMGFTVYQMDAKSAFLYGQIEEEVYVCQPPGFEDPDHSDKVYKVVKVLYGLHQAPRAWYDTLATYLLSNGFQRGQIDQTLFIKSQKGKFNYSDVKSASTPTDLEKPLVKWDVADDVDSLLELVAYTDSDYAGATLDRKSTTEGCQFLGNRLISCNAETNCSCTSTTEVKFVDAGSYWDSTICIIENPVQHSKIKHIEIMHHFIRDCNAKKLIQMAKIDTQLNVADLLTKGFDAGRFQYLSSSIGYAQSSSQILETCL
ncbi:putative ribonuclease H-like domain-containing protein [Tanacetum coccineum]